MLWKHVSRHLMSLTNIFMENVSRTCNHTCMGMGKKSLRTSTVAEQISRDTQCHEQSRSGHSMPWKKPLDIHVIDKAPTVNKSQEHEFGESLQRCHYSLHRNTHLRTSSQREAILQ